MILLALCKSTGAIETETRLPNQPPQKEKRYLYWLFFVKQRMRNGLKFWCRGKWAQCLEDYTWCFWSWRGTLCSLAACIFPMKHHCRSMENRVKNPTNRDETYHWQETMFLSVYGEKVSYGYCERGKQSYLRTSLWKNNAMSKFPRILFQCICFLSSRVLGSKMLRVWSLKAVLPVRMFVPHGSKLWAARLNVLCPSPCNNLFCRTCCWRQPDQTSGDIWASPLERTVWNANCSGQGFFPL